MVFLFLSYVCALRVYVAKLMTYSMALSCGNGLDWCTTCAKRSFVGSNIKAIGPVFISPPHCGKCPEAVYNKVKLLYRPRPSLP